MNKIIKIIVSLIIIIVLGILGYFGYKYFTKNFTKQDIIDFTQRIMTPDPLSGPVRSDLTSNLCSEKIIKDTNAEREKEGLSTLMKNQDLMSAAEFKVDDMFKNQYFEHVSPIDGKDVTYWVGEVNYLYLYVGENLALGDFKSESELVQAWMNSPGHRENIMNSNYTEIGVAAKKGMIEGRDTWLAVQIFADPTSNCTPPDANVKAEIEKKQADYNQIKDLNKQIEKLQSEGKDLMNQGNAKIDKGNHIMNETKDKAQAQPYWEEGERLYNEGKSKINQANDLIRVVNNKTSLYDEINNLIDKYNAQVNEYNKCLGL